MSGAGEPTSPSDAKPETVLRFRGEVECRRDPSSPLGLTLVGAVDSDEVALLAFLGNAPEDLPGRLAAVRVERLGEAQYRIAADDRSWPVRASRIFLHRDVARAFYAALPPRKVPWRKRLLWRGVLAALATPLGRRWL